MEHLIRFGDGPEEVLVETAGVASLEGMDAVVRELLGDTRYRPGLALLFDHSRLDWAALRAEDIVRRLHVALKHADLLGPARIAVVALDPRMASARRVRSDEPRYEVFTTVAAARTWLGSARAGAA